MSVTNYSRSSRQALCLAAAAVLVLVPTAGAEADTTIDGPIGLGAAESFGVLANSTVTNTGPTTIDGDLGLSPGTAVEGFSVGAGTVTGVQYVADAVALQAQSDLTTAYNVAASLTPSQSNLGELSGLSLTPGVYSGGELSLGGPVPLVLAGSAESVWVFQAASTLITSTGSSIVLTGGASACNVFWQVGSSATLAGGTFFGTVMADQSVTMNTGANVTGRVLARGAAVTLDTNTVQRPEGCDDEEGEVSISPVITSGAQPSGTVGTPYSSAVTATGAPTPTFSTTGSLPDGLAFDATTGVISGTPTTAGTSVFTVTASNGTTPDASSDYSIVIAAPGTGGGSGTDGGDAGGGTGGGTGGSGSDGGADGSSDSLAATGSASDGLVLTAFALLSAGLILVTRRTRVRDGRA